MSSHPTALLGLVLCLGCAIHTQEGTLPTPSISAEPDSVIPPGQAVTVVCRGPAGAEMFRLESENKTPKFEDVNIVSQPGASETEARFHIEAFSEVTAGRHRCIYRKGPDSWSKRSEWLELVVTCENVTSPCPSLSSALRRNPFPSSLDTPALGGLRTEQLYVLIGVSAVFLLCLLLLVLFLHRQRQRKQGSPSSKDEEQRPQQRLSQAVDVLERKADVATVEGLPEKGREMGTPAPSAGDPEEVTYAQLDHRALTRRTAHAASPQFTEPVAESGVYVAIIRN
ncbi:PREDICTED: leukocyte-associated immunoglobulin-like receptor 1 [Propithecus coquereli]|nr:PREDICTED: leukocyte-associated immunoglobulin-like receptor 1 [Propithecus coquereli]